MFIALVAMFMGTLRVNAISPNGGAVIAEKDFTGGFEGNYPNWYRFGDNQDGSISSDPDGVAITVGSKTGNLWQPQLRVIDEEIQLREGGNYKVVVTAKFPCNGQLQINMGSWSGNEQYPVDVVSTGEFQEVEINCPEYPYDCNNSGGVGDAHLLIQCGDFLGTTIVKKIQVWDLDAGPYAVLSDDGKTLTFYCDGNKSTYEPSNVYDLNEGNNTPEWIQNTSIETVAFYETFKNARPTTTFQWFYELENLSSIVNIENLNTSEVTDMSGMFLQCTSLTELDLSHFDTSKVTDMSYMFCWCTSLENLDLSSFNTSKVDNMYYMFYYCPKLVSLNVSSFNTSNVTNMGFMFGICQVLKELDLSGFNTEKVKRMNGMFGGCSALTSLDLSSFVTYRVEDMEVMFNNCKNLTTITVSTGWDTDNVQNSANMFSYSYNLVGGAGTIYDENHVDQDYAHIDGLNGKPGYLTVAPHAYAVLSDDGKTLTFYYDGNKSTYEPGIVYDLNEGDNAPGWLEKKTIETVVFDVTFKNVRPTTTCKWFYNLTSLSSFEGWENLNTSEVTNMNNMFFDCISLTSLDLRSFNTSNVVDMKYMFAFCNGLNSLDVSTFNTSKVEDMQWMFNGCAALTSLDLRSFNTSNVQDMRYMFNSCANLTTITVSTGWDTDNVQKSANMFFYCNNLVGGAGTTYNSGKVDKEYAIADGLNGKPGYLTAVSYGITVSGKAVTFANKYDVLGNETVNYDDDLNILTLIDADVSSINIASTAPNDLHVNVIGVCKVRHASTKGNAFTTSIAKTTIEGNGKLTIISSHGIGIKINRSRAAGLLVKDVDLEVAGYKAGIAGTVNSTGRTFYSSLGFDNANCIVGSLQEAAASVTAIKMLECIRCSMTAGEFVAHKVEANPMIIQRSGGISTDIDQVTSNKYQVTSDDWYTMDGRKLSGKPNAKGIYIHNGKKVLK